MFEYVIRTCSKFVCSRKDAAVFRMPPQTCQNTVSGSPAVARANFRGCQSTLVQVVSKTLRTLVQTHTDNFPIAQAHPERGETDASHTSCDVITRNLKSSDRPGHVASVEKESADSGGRIFKEETLVESELLPVMMTTEVTTLLFVDFFHNSTLTFGRCFSSRAPPCPGCRRPTVRTPSPSPLWRPRTPKQMLAAYLAVIASYQLLC